jgi:hypothetical protein
MAYLEGTLGLTSGTQDYTIPFAPAFVATPDVVIAVVENTSADAVKFLITAHVVDKSATDFTVRLDSAPNSNNYVLAWVAGSASVIFQALVAGGRRISEIPLLTDDLLDGDYFPVVHTSPVPTTKRVLWSTIRSLFARRRSIPPPSPATSGSVFDISVDANYFYIRNGSTWGRVPLETSNWSNGSVFIPRQEGVQQLTSGNKIVTVTYPVAFSGSGTPRALWSIRNTASENKLILTGLLTAESLSAFELTLQSAPDSSNYYLYWESKLID